MARRDKWLSNVMGEHINAEVSSWDDSAMILFTSFEILTKKLEKARLQQIRETKIKNQIYNQAKESILPFNDDR